MAIGDLPCGQTPRSPPSPTLPRVGERPTSQSQVGARIFGWACVMACCARGAHSGRRGSGPRGRWQVVHRPTGNSGFQSCALSPLPLPTLIAGRTATQASLSWATRGCHNLRSPGRFALRANSMAGLPAATYRAECPSRWAACQHAVRSRQSAPLASVPRGAPGHGGRSLRSFGQPGDILPVRERGARGRGRRA